MVQVPVAGLNDPRDGVFESWARSAGSMSDTVTPLASEGPSLVAVTV